jgi:hypothetical protein
MSAVNLRAESTTFDGDKVYAPLIVLPSTGVKLTLSPAWIISHGTDGYVFDGQSTESLVNDFFMFFS